MLATSETAESARMTCARGTTAQVHVLKRIRSLEAFLHRDDWSAMKNVTRDGAFVRLIIAVAEGTLPWGEASPLKLDDLVTDLTQRTLHATHDDLAHDLAASTPSLPVAVSRPKIDWPKFSFPAPFVKVYSTGNGDAFYDHRADFLS